MSIVSTRVSANNEGGIATVSVSLAHNADGLSDTITKEAIAVKSRKDKGDPAIGERLALGRALVKAGNALIGQAEGLDKHREDMREYRKRQKERRKGHQPGKKVKWEGLKVGDYFRYVSASAGVNDNNVYRVSTIHSDGFYTLDWNNRYDGGEAQRTTFKPGSFAAPYVVIADPKDF